MKKQTKMACLILAFAAALNGCKKNEILQSNSDVINKGNIVHSGGDQKWDLLGFGLDVTGDLLAPSSVSDVSIFDMKKFEQDFIDRIDAKINVTNTSEGSEQYYGGASAMDYLKDINNKRSFDINGNATIAGSEKATGTGTETAKGLNFTGSFTKNSSDQNTITYSSKYSYATFEVVQRVKRLRFTGDVTMELLKNYLNTEFVSNVANKSAEDLVKRYGTHILLDISIGGRLRFNYSGIVTNESNTEKKTSGVKTGFGLNILKVVGVNITKDKSKEEMIKVSTETREKDYTGKYYGGTNSGRSISFDKDGNTSENINIANWQQSITDKNAALIDVGRAVFLYDFIADPVKKAQVKAAVEKHIKDAQPKELGEVPVYVYNSIYGGDHYFTPVNQPTIGGGGYAQEGIAFYAFSKPTEGAVPIYVYNNSRDSDHYFTPDNKPTIGNGTMINEGIAFYSYPSIGTNRIPIYVYNSFRGDHYFTPDNQPTIGNGSMWNEGVAFYAPK